MNKQNKIANDGINDFLVSRSKKNNILEISTLKYEDIVDLLGQQNWYPINEALLPDPYPPCTFDVGSGGRRVDAYKHKMRKGIHGYKLPSQILTLNMNLSELWYTDNKIAIQHLDDYMLYQHTVFVHATDLVSDDVKDGVKQPLPVYR